MSNTKWKDYLLKSGIPLEYEVKELLDKRGCITHFEQSYLRPDKNNIINEFSFDIGAAYKPDLAFFDLLIECKYRHPSTNWIFLPDYTTPIGEMTTSSFMHVNDHFTQETKHPFWLYQTLSIANNCSKGIELTSDGQNPKTITQATSQLAYALAEAITEGMYNQYSGEAATTEQIFYHIPIIVTTANLYRLDQDINMTTIQKSKDIEEVSTKQDYLMLQYHIGKDLEKHNKQVFQKFIKKHGKSRLNKKLKSFNKNIEHVCDVISQSFCPQAILIIQHNEDNKGFNKLFELMDETNLPSEKTIPFIEGKENQELYRKQLKDSVAPKKAFHDDIF